MHHPSIYSPTPSVVDGLGGLDRLQVEIKFEPALVGMFVLTLHEGEGLGASDPVLRPNPYVLAILGEK